MSLEIWPIIVISFFIAISSSFESWNTILPETLYKVVVLEDFVQSILTGMYEWDPTVSFICLPIRTTELYSDWCRLDRKLCPPAISQGHARPGWCISPAGETDRHWLLMCGVITFLTFIKDGDLAWINQPGTSGIWHLRLFPGAHSPPHCWKTWDNPSYGRITLCYSKVSPSFQSLYWHPCR